MAESKSIAVHFEPATESHSFESKFRSGRAIFVRKFVTVAGVWWSPSPRGRRICNEKAKFGHCLFNGNSVKDDSCYNSVRADMKNQMKQKPQKWRYLINSYILVALLSNGKCKPSHVQRLEKVQDFFELIGLPLNTHSDAHQP